LLTNLGAVIIMLQFSVADISISYWLSSDQAFAVFEDLLEIGALSCVLIARCAIFGYSLRTRRERAGGSFEKYRMKTLTRIGTLLPKSGMLDQSFNELLAKMIDAEPDHPALRELHKVALPGSKA
jgi:hypothetical protein